MENKVKSHFRGKGQRICVLPSNVNHPVFTKRSPEFFWGGFFIPFHLFVQAHDRVKSASKGGVQRESTQPSKMHDVGMDREILF